MPLLATHQAPAPGAGAGFSGAQANFGDQTATDIGGDINIEADFIGQNQQIVSQAANAPGQVANQAVFPTNVTQSANAGGVILNAELRAD